MTLIIQRIWGSSFVGPYISSRESCGRFWGHSILEFIKKQLYSYFDFGKDLVRQKNQLGEFRIQRRRGNEWKLCTEATTSLHAQLCHNNDHFSLEIIRCTISCLIYLPIIIQLHKWPRSSTGIPLTLKGMGNNNNSIKFFIFVWWINSCKANYRHSTVYMLVITLWSNTT
jgi:hypothetical protein